LTGEQRFRTGEKSGNQNPDFDLGFPPSTLHRHLEEAEKFKYGRQPPGKQRAAEIDLPNLISRFLMGESGKSGKSNRSAVYPSRLWPLSMRGDMSLLSVVPGELVLPAAHARSATRACALVAVGLDTVFEGEYDEFTDDS
jgi:hypothetical protein